MPVLITVFDPVICKTPDVPYLYIVWHFFQGKVVPLKVCCKHYMHLSRYLVSCQQWNFFKSVHSWRSYTIRNTTAYFLVHSVVLSTHVCLALTICIPQQSSLWSSVQHLFSLSFVLLSIRSCRIDVDRFSALIKCPKYFSLRLWTFVVDMSGSVMRVSYCIPGTFTRNSAARCNQLDSTLANLEATVEVW